MPYMKGCVLESFRCAITEVYDIVSSLYTLKPRKSLQKVCNVIQPYRYCGTSPFNIRILAQDMTLGVYHIPTKVSTVTVMYIAAVINLSVKDRASPSVVGLGNLV